MDGAPDILRYDKQILFAPLGAEGQRLLRQAKALVVGVGGLGSWMAELLVRAGVGTLRLADFDTVDLTNIHRQGLYDESDAAAKRMKVQAASERLGAVNRQVRIEAIPRRLDKDTVGELAGGMDLILDGTDNFASRFVINDYAVRSGTPWVFAGAVGAEGQTMTIVPGWTPCLRCVYDGPPPPCTDPSCRVAGVIGPAVAAIASLAAAEALKILAGRLDAVSPYLLKLDLWTNQLQRIEVARSAEQVDCPCCKRKFFEFLDGD